MLQRKLFLSLKPLQGERRTDVERTQSLKSPPPAAFGTGNRLQAVEKQLGWNWDFRVKISPRGPSDTVI